LGTRVLSWVCIRWGIKLTPHFLIVLRLWMSGAVPLIHQYIFMV
jgi:hypothetical protein